MSWVRERRQSAHLDLYTSKHPARAWFLLGVLVGTWLGGATGLIGRALEAALR